ncbi:MAG TPA: hypothetical protein VM577_21420, partial [Anaerovoracaceae bacterium]|nr:hypothetical protein [Anaerovoracaceae bacterium]
MFVHISILPLSTAYVHSVRCCLRPSLVQLFVRTPDSSEERRDQMKKIEMSVYDEAEHWVAMNERNVYL